jgi:hypothetical protein
MSFSSRCPTRHPIRSRQIVTGLSAITCDITRNPLFAVGSMITRKSAASLHSDVIAAASWAKHREVELKNQAVPGRPQHASVLAELRRPRVLRDSLAKAYPRLRTGGPNVQHRLKIHLIVQCGKADGHKSWGSFATRE